MKGQTNNPHGRPKGKPNHVTAQMRVWVQQVIDNNRKQLEADIKALEPKDRWLLVEKLMNYILAKKQGVSIEIEKEAEYKQLEKLIDSAPEQFIDEVTSRILKLREAEHE